MNEFKKCLQQKHSDTNNGFICRLIIYFISLEKNVSGPMCVLMCGKRTKFL